MAEANEVDLLFAYGSLQTDEGIDAKLYRMAKRTDGAYPTIEPDPDGSVKGKLIVVDDWESKDRYEGRKEDPDRTLYWRLQTNQGPWVYVGNPHNAGKYWPDHSIWDVSYTREQVRKALGRATLDVLD